MGKRIYLTVDTECHSLEKYNQFISGNTKNGTYGIERILQLGQELNVPVNVFLDIPECRAYGDDHIRSLVKLICKYGQPIFLHVHPDYIMDPKRKHLWEYTKDEQRDILRQAFQDYKRFCGEQERIFFRAGAWSVNHETYEVLSELRSETGVSEIVDLSYVYQSKWRCRLSETEYGAANACRRYQDIVMFPNTTYIGLDYLGKKYAYEFCVPTPCFREAKRVLDENRLSNITYTMHSWDFIKRWFFLPGIISGHNRQIRVFRKVVAYARAKGYEFSDLRSFNLSEEEDQCVNICRTVPGKIACLWYNFARFADTGRSFKKYAPLYFLPYALCAIAIALIACLLAR